MKTDTTTLPPLPSLTPTAPITTGGRDSPDMESSKEHRAQMKKKPQTIQDFLPPGMSDTQSNNEPVKPILQLYPVRTVVIDPSLPRTGSKSQSGSIMSLNPSKSYETDNLSGLDAFGQSFSGKSSGGGVHHHQHHGGVVSGGTESTIDRHATTESKQSVTTTSSSASGLSTSFNGSMIRSMGALRDTTNNSQPHVHFLNDVNTSNGSKDGFQTNVSYQTEFKDHFAQDSSQAISGVAPVGGPSPFEKGLSRMSSRRSSIIAMQPPDGRKMVVTSRRNSLAPSWHSKGRRKSSGSIKSSGSASVHTEGVGFDREVLPSEYNLNQLPAEPAIPHINSDYYDYVRSTQKVGSLNFIQKLDSTEEVRWTNRAKKVKLIGRYLIGEQIGKGSFGKVKEGICSESLLRVAVKIISKKRAKRIPQGVEGIIREIKMLRKFKHENVITLIDVHCKVEDASGSTGVFPWFESIEDEPITWVYEDGTSKQQKVQVLKYYLVLQYCPWTLQGILDRSPGKKLPVNRAHYFFAQMMNGLSYLHAQSVIHRDIKPGNMLITSDKVLNLSDFGVAEQFNPYCDTSLKTSTFAGTHQFLSPELTSAKDVFDGEKVDIWAAGVTLYNMLTGRYPFETNDDGNILELYEKITACNLVLPQDLDPSIRDLLKGMLAKDPENRFSVADVLSHPWTQTYYLGTIRHLKPPTAGVASTKSVLSSIRETSMLAYLQQLFAEEIEIDLEDRGTYESDSTLPTEFYSNMSARVSTVSNPNKLSSRSDKESTDSSPPTTAPNSNVPERRVTFFSKLFGKK